MSASQSAHCLDFKAMDWIHAFKVGGSRERERRAITCKPAMWLHSYLGLFKKNKVIHLQSTLLLEVMLKLFLWVQ